MTVSRKFLKYHIPAIFWMLIIFVQSSIPKLTVPNIGFKLQDKSFHAFIYAILAILLLRALKNSEQFKDKFIFWTFWIGAFYGASDEIHQYFVPGRTADVFDVIADIIGVCLVISIAYFVEKRRKKNKIAQREKTKWGNSIIASE